MTVSKQTKATQPARRCREHFTDEIEVGEDSVTMDRHCDLDQHHTGPHSCLQSKRAMAERKAWEEANPHEVDKRRGDSIVV